MPTPDVRSRQSLTDERAVTAAGFLRRAAAFSPTASPSKRSSPTTAAATARRCLTRRCPTGPGITSPVPTGPKTNGKVDRYNRTLGAEFAYARPWTCETQRADYLQRWLVHYNYHRAHTAISNQPPASLAPTTVTNVMMQNI